MLGFFMGPHGRRLPLESGFLFLWCPQLGDAFRNKPNSTGRVERKTDPPVALGNAAPSAVAIRDQG
jgi:hypothetical protein